MREGCDGREKLVKVQPRHVLWEREKADSKASTSVEADESQLTHFEKVKRNMLKQSGVKFDARGSSKEDIEGLWGEPDAPADAPHPESKAPSGPPKDGPEPVGGDEMQRKPGSKSRPRRSRRVVFKESFHIFKKRFGRIWHYRTKTGYFAVALIACVIASWQFASSIEREAARREFHAKITREYLKVPQDFSKSLDEALLAMRGGDAKAALSKLRGLEAEQPGVASMDYLVALAAMLSGDLDLAYQKATESIEKFERVSDSIALQANIEAFKRAGRNYPLMGDSRLRNELLLRQAVLADAANPIPFIRLSFLLRYQDRNQEAEEMLRAGWARLNPVDSHVMVDATLALIRLERMPDAELPQNTPDLGKSPGQLFAGAYVAMRRKDFARAAEALELCRGMIPSDLFGLILNDPAFAPFRAEPGLSRFFRS
jgi:hypothetical protein